MRPTAKPQSALINPLNRILGRESNVRILRALARTREPVGTGDLARITSLNLSGVRRTIELLIDSGVLMSLGAGPRRLVRLRDQHPLAADLRRLFLVESARLPSIGKSIAAAVEKLGSPPLSVWFQGPVTLGADKPGTPLTVGVLADDTDLDLTVAALSRELTVIEVEYDVTIEIRAFSRADFMTMTPRDQDYVKRAMLVWGPHPASFLNNDAAPTRRAGNRSHEALDARALALANAVAKKIRADPSLIGRARQRVAARMRSASAGERKELKEWDNILRSGSAARLRQLLVDAGPRATRLRQTLPFLDALTREERNRLLESSDQE